MCVSWGGGVGVAAAPIRLPRRRTPKRVCAHVSPRPAAACARTNCPSPDPTCEARAAAGGHSEGDLQGGGGPAEDPARRRRARRRGNAGVPGRVPPKTRRSSGAASPPRPPPPPASAPRLTGRARPPLASGWQAVISGAVGRSGGRQLVRLDDHGGGSGASGSAVRAARRATNPSALRAAAAAGRTESLAHVVRAVAFDPTAAPRTAPPSRPARPTEAREGQNTPRLVLLPHPRPPTR